MTHKFPDLTLEPNQWHSINVSVGDNTRTTRLDDKEVSRFQSEGIAHPTKRTITLAGNKSARADDVKVSALLR